MANPEKKPNEQLGTGRPGTELVDSDQQKSDQRSSEPTGADQLGAKKIDSTEKGRQKTGRSRINAQQVLVVIIIVLLINIVILVPVLDNLMTSSPPGRADINRTGENVQESQGQPVAMDLTTEATAEIPDAALAEAPAEAPTAAPTPDPTPTTEEAIAFDLIKELSGGNQVWSVAFNQNDTLMATGLGNGVIMVWDVENIGSGADVSLRVLTGHTAPVRAVVFDPTDPNRLASSAADHTIKVWDLQRIQEEQLLITFTEHTDEVSSLAYSPDGSLLASGSADSTIKLWDMRELALLDTLNGHEEWVLSVAFDPKDGNRLASGAADNKIALWDIATGEQAQTLSGHNDWVTSIAFSPIRRSLASASYDKTVLLWDVDRRRGDPPVGQRMPINIISSVAFSPDGNYLASGAHDGNIFMWDLSENTSVSIPEVHSDIVRSVTFSPQGDLFASGSEDGTIKLWQIR